MFNVNTKVTVNETGELGKIVEALPSIECVNVRLWATGKTEWFRFDEVTLA